MFFLTKNIYKSVNICPEIRKKSSQKTCFSWKQSIHSGLGITLSIPLDRAWNSWSVETPRQPLGAKLEASASNPLTENRFSFSFSANLKSLLIWPVMTKLCSYLHATKAATMQLSHLTHLISNCIKVLVSPAEYWVSKCSCLPMFAFLSKCTYLPYSCQIELWQ
jgi:hypothetical protein